MEALVEMIRNGKKIIIYGASTQARNVFFLLRHLGIEVQCFVVSNTKGNPASIEGVPVRIAEEVLPCNTDTLVLIALLKEHYEAVRELVIRCGITEYQPAWTESEVDISLRKTFFGKANPIFFNEGDLWANTVSSEVTNLQMDCDIVHLYEVCCHKDKAILKTQDRGWTIPIQAGAKNTEIILTEVRDDVGEYSISERNYNYCELTAAYWMWKNDVADYIGLCHYRRKIMLSDERIAELVENDIDICLPIPGVLCPSVREAYINMKPVNVYYEEDLNRMLQVINNLCPEYSKSTRDVLAGKFFMHGNILIAKREIYHKWCEFWYPVLEAVEESYLKEGIERRDRYLGYLGEVLTTIFIFHNKGYRYLYTDLKLL